jgi:hypothetical protein
MVRSLITGPGRLDRRLVARTWIGASTSGPAPRPGASPQHPGEAQESMSGWPLRRVAATPSSAPGSALIHIDDSQGNRSARTRAFHS